MSVRSTRLSIRSCILALMISEAISTSAQSSSASFSEVMRDLGLIQQNFQATQNGFISCSMSYLYSKEYSPAKYLDSLSGLFKASGSLQYAKLGNTETIQNDSMMLTIYNDDKAMLASPAIRRRGDDRRLFLNTIDSAFVARNTSTVSIAEKGGLKTMRFRFTDSSRYYNCILVYDATTYIPQTISYILRSSKLAESGKPPAEGGVITIRFRGYSSASFDASIFNVNKYVGLKAGTNNSLQSNYNGYSFYQNGDIRKRDLSK